MLGSEGAAENGNYMKKMWNLESMLKVTLKHDNSEPRNPLL